jgi:hypothetical protein
MNDELLETLRRESEARRLMHPDWPSHPAPTIYEPRRGERKLGPATMPIGKLDGARGYCKYCYTEHRNWWLMDQRDYGTKGLTIVLCGKCEYTIAAEYADVDASVPLISPGE